MRSESVGMRRTLCVLLLVLGTSTLTSWAEVRYRQLGAAILSHETALSCWLVEGPPFGRAVALKMVSLGRDGECHIVLDRAQLKELQRLFRQTASARPKLQDGEIAVLGSVTSLESRIEGAVVRAGGVTARCLVLHESPEKEQRFVIEAFQEASVFRLLEQAQAALR